MNFTVSQSSLQTALDIVMKGIGSNPSLPILSGVYLKAQEGTLEIQSNDLTVSIKHKMAANIEEEGETVVSAKVLQTIVKNLPDAAITFKYEDEGIKLTCQKSTYHLTVLPVADWPAFPEVIPEKSIELPSALLSKMVDKIYRVVSHDVSRPILQGIFLTAEENTIRLVATDSFRLAVCDTHTDTPTGEKFEAIISGEAIHNVLSMRTMTETIMVGISDNQVVFTFGNTTHVSRKIEGNYPDYKKLLAPSCSTAITLPIEETSAAIKHVSVVALQNFAVRLDIDAEGGEICFSSSSPDQGNASETIKADVEGKSLTIGFNYQYVFDCLNALSEQKSVRFELLSETQPAVFKASGKINYLYLLIPVHL